MLSNNSDRANNLLNQLAYTDVYGDWKPGQNLCDVLENSGRKDLADQLRQEGLGHLEIRDYVNHNENGSGFAGIAFCDPRTGEVGMTFRGTENMPAMGSDLPGILTGDREAVHNQIDMLDNGSTAVTGDSAQAREAIAFYLNNRSSSGNNYLYGHSKGGELAEEIYAQYYPEIRQAHVFNPQPINWTKLTPEQQAAFMSGNFDAVVIDGDIVWMLGGVPYPVRIVQNNGTNDGFFGPHELTSASYDENGNLIISSSPYWHYLPQIMLGTLAFTLISVVQWGYRVVDTAIDTVVSFGRFMVEQTEQALRTVHDGIARLCDHVRGRIQDLGNRIQNLVNTIGSAVGNWIRDNFNRGHQYATANPQIRVDTVKLQQYAQRLQSINKRISKVDIRMDRLYWRVGLVGMYKLMKADILTGYSLRLGRCISYLTDTANEFEKVERELNNAL